MAADDEAAVHSLVTEPVFLAGYGHVTVEEASHIQQAVDESIDAALDETDLRNKIAEWQGEIDLTEEEESHTHDVTALGSTLAPSSSSVTPGPESFAKDTGPRKKPRAMQPVPGSATAEAGPPAFASTPMIPCGGCRPAQGSGGVSDPQELCGTGRAPTISELKATIAGSDNRE